MNVRTNYHKRKVTLVLQIILANVLLVGLLWYMDVHDIHWIKDTWIEWVTDRHFLIRIAIWTLYILVIWQVIKYWYKFWGWFANIVIKTFYR